MTNLVSNYISPSFVDLPIEILYRIVSAAQSVIIPCMNESTMERNHSERRDSLLALCKVCRSLRLAFLPLLWESLEACCLPGHQANQSQRDRWELLAKRLAGQLSVINVIRPPYASYVRFVNVAIEPRIAHEMISTLAPALALMPNLHTIQIVIDIPRYRTCNVFEIGSELFNEAFKDQFYPSVKMAILPAQARAILECIPEVHEVYLNQSYPYEDDFFEYLSNLATNCNKLDKFGWIEFTEDYNSRAALLVKKLSMIRRLDYYMKDFNVNEILHLAKLQNLEVLSLIIDAYDNLSQCDNAALEVIETARKVVGTFSGLNRQLNVMLRDERLTFTSGQN